MAQTFIKEYGLKDRLDLDYSAAYFKLDSVELPDTIIGDHVLQYVDFSGGNFDRSDFKDVRFEKVFFDRVSLIGANFRNTCLRGAHFYRSHLSGAILNNVDAPTCIFNQTYLSNADLSKGNFKGANFNKADLRGANLRGANLGGANLCGADLTHANIDDAVFDGAKFSSSTKGIVVSPAAWLRENFEKTKEGYTVYALFYPEETPDQLKPEKGDYITRPCDYSRVNDVAYGLYFTNLDEALRLRKFDRYSNVWECLLEWEDLAETVVPLQATHQARCSRLKLVEKIKCNER